jgi:hypothetical protein
MRGTVPCGTKGSFGTVGRITVAYDAAFLRVPKNRILPCKGLVQKGLGSIASGSRAMLARSMTGDRERFESQILVTSRNRRLPINSSSGLYAGNHPSTTFNFHSQGVNAGDRLTIVKNVFCNMFPLENHPLHLAAWLLTRYCSASSSRPGNAVSGEFVNKFFQKARQAEFHRDWI